MADKGTQPIVIRKIIKGGGHHGGAWKVAYADFVTAMMAFFLLLWLLGSTTKEQRAAISEYFNNPTNEPGMSVTPSPSAVHGPGGASTSMIEQDGTSTPATAPPMIADAEEKAPDEESAEEIAEKKFRARMEDMLKELRDLAEKSELLKQYQDQLLFDITDEGLRIQILDKDNRPMFDLGSATLRPHTTEILREIAKVINQVPAPVSITGYTDGRRLERAGYSNWELSTDRANAARRALTTGGMQENKVSRIVGLASSKLFNPNDPMDPTNRRVSITVLSPQSAAAAPNGSPAPAPTAAPAKPAAKS